MTRPPSTYAEWVACLEAFERGEKDEEALFLMEQGRLEWTPGVAERFMRRLSDTMNERLDELQRRMARDFAYAQGTETELVRTLMAARRRFGLLHRLASIPALPGEVGASLKEMIGTVVRQTQNSLEDSAKTDWTGKLRLIIRNNPLTTFDHPEALESAKREQQAALQQTAASFTSRRRVILP
ncbi:hypothetical protein [Paenibacillus humicus]|uniref:hypothetical protein n=1 Tax=Paenibacillus humicus TaxID=412861 RepID=UPI000FD7C5A7|nr:hypothetical protein [Paenibacillus humicus]